MEQQPSSYRPVHRPRPKLKMPLFGNMLGGGGGGPKPSNREENKWAGKLMPIIVAIALIAIGIDFFNTKNDTKRTFTGADDVKSMVLDGQVVKKWYNVFPAKNEVEYVITIMNKKGDTRVVSFRDEKTNFGDLVLPYNFIQKKEGSLDVTLKRYIKKDTVVTLKDTLITLKY
ncbi:MAG: hypothetical protein U5N85_17075 [Arcicella sp.]|nr:hypothetical protein [Arcicella sp.]